MFREPTLTFTIPSVHDGLHLDCRIYHPASLCASPNTLVWRRHGAVLAHPYAPLGGSYDDPVVEVVGETMLREGFLLATFNFRGAGNSGGKTSWTAKAERCDFQSVIAFVAYYIHHLDPFQNVVAAAAGETDEAEREPGEAITTGVCRGTAQAPLLVIGGYSYGSLITTQLPPLDAILEPLASPASDSSEAQIRLRATSLAEQQNTAIGLARKALLELSARRSTASSRGVRVGGDEGGRASPRRSTDGGGQQHHRRSLSRELEDKLHDIVAKTRSNLGSAREQRHNRNVSNGTLRKVLEEEDLGSGGGDDDDDDIHGTSETEKQAATKEPAEGRLPRLPSFTMPRPAYVLISPIPGLASHLVTMRVLPNALARANRPDEDPAEAKLVRNPTLAVYGDADMFVTGNKAREWVARLGGAQGSRFRGVEVPTAGHFWAEENVMGRMLDLVGGFLRSLLVEEAEKDRESVSHI